MKLYDKLREIGKTYELNMGLKLRVYFKKKIENRLRGVMRIYRRT